MLAFIFYTLLAILFIIILALVLPIRIFVRAAGGTDDGFHGVGRVMLFGGVLGGGGEYEAGALRIGVYLFSWRMFGVDPARFAGHGKKIAQKPKEKAEKPAEPSLGEEHGKRPFMVRFRDALRAAGNYHLYAKIALREITSIFHVDRFAVGVTFGLGDPATTGKVIGALYAINGLLPARYVIRPGWDFTRRVFSGDADIAVTFRTYLFWIHLVRGFLTYTRYRREGWFSFGKAPRAQEA